MRALSISISLLLLIFNADHKLILFINADRHIDQLYEDLMGSYNKNVRPVTNATDVLLVKFGASLCRLIDVVSCTNWFE